MLYNVKLELNIPVEAQSEYAARRIAYHSLKDDVTASDFECQPAKKNVQYDNTWDADEYVFSDGRSRTLREIWDSMS